MNTSPRPPATLVAVSHPLPNKPRHRGFALLITIVLLAFLVLLLVSLASLTRVETQVAANGQSVAKARQNALSALSLALGQLQKFAGPDQRATAHADLTAGVNNPYYTGVWDSSVPSPTATTPLVWLVSGNETNPTASAPTTDLSSAADSVLLVNKSANNETALQVRVRKQEIAATDIPGLTGSVPIGHFAYWIGDEGVKARANLVSPWPVTGSTGAQRDQESAYTFGTAQRSGIEQMAREPTPAPTDGTAFGTAAYPPNAPNLATALSPQQLPLALPASLSAADQAAMRTAYQNRFHDLTTHSASLLADQRQGGLKKDLTRLLETNAASTYPGVAAADADYLFPVVGAAGANYFENPPTWGRLRSFTANTSNGTALAPRLPTATDQGIAPVLAWVEVGYAAATNLAGTRVRMHLFPRILLWNPYNVPLAVASCEIGFRGHESHYVTIDATAPGTGSVKFSLGGGKFISSGSTSFLRFRIISSGVIPAGGCQLYTLASNSTAYDAGLSANNLLSAGDRPNYAYVEDTSTPFTLSATAATPLRITHPATPGVEVFTFLRQTNSPSVALTGTQPPPQNHQFLGRVSVEVFGLSNPADIQGLGFAPDFRISIRARLGGENNALPMRWIANGNIRAPYINRSHIPADITRYNPLYNGVVTSGTVINSPQASTRLNRTFAIGGSTDDDLVLFQVPRADTPLFSIADLRHAHLAPVGTAPAYPVATSLADFRLNARTATAYAPTTAASPNGAINYRLYDYAYLLNDALWDRYFFSTVPAGLPANYATTPGFAALPNSRLTYLARDGSAPAAVDLLQPDLAAKSLLLQGGFNVNSTSVQAWRAQLASLNALPYDPVAGTAGATELNRPFSRFNRPPGNSTQPWRGFRELTDTQLNALAEAIVAQVRLRGPFLSLGSFVNRELRADSADLNSDLRGLKGALQAALDTVDQSATAAHRINTATAWNSDASAVPSSSSAGYDMEALHGHPTSTLPISSRNAGAPGNLTQADLLAALGATLTARSDTFVIRTYGDVQNPVTGQLEGQAWCEAIAQRLPDYVNPTDSAEDFPPTHPDNLRFGRTFKIVSFRWLSPDDI